MQTNFNTAAPTLLVLVGAMLILEGLSIQPPLQVNSTPLRIGPNDPERREQVKLAKGQVTGRFGEPAHNWQRVQGGPGGPENGTPTRSKPPRGYCVRISRAIKPTSRCYKHLVHLGPTESASNDKADRHKTIIATAAWQSNNNKHKEGSSKRREELVYVRLETLGDKITNLSTQIMNERVLAGLLGELILPETAKSGDKSAPSAGGQLTWNEQEDGAEEREEIRAQILGSSSSAPASASSSSAACQLAMEKFLCRLAYPSCHFRQTDVGALVRPPCREDCLLLRDSICPSLNWSKFSRTLQRAFNKTLKSTISPIDLIVDGDPSATLASLPISSEQFVSKLIVQAGAKGDDQRPSPGKSLGSGPEQVKEASFVGQNQEHEHEDASAVADPGHLWAPGYNLSSSLHFYWPHEKSIERCESLPPLRTMIAILTAGNGKVVHEAGKLPHQEKTKFGASKWIIDRKRHRPVCSNAHLTEIRADTMGEDKLDKRENKDEGASRDKTAVAAHSDSHRLDCLSSSYGSDYTGSHNTSRSGLACQSWASQSPHKHKMSELLFDNMREANNYCRNPGGLELQPWCYTLHPGVRWEYCNIETCYKGD